MKKVDDVYERGIIAFVEQFCYAAEELRQYVVYTYYDENGEALYVGRSRDFCNTHYLNGNAKEFMDNVVYVGFLIMESEKEIKEAVKYVISWRNPKFNKRKYLVKKDLAPLEDDIVLLKEQMERRWEEFTGQIRPTPPNGVRESAKPTEAVAPNDSAGGGKGILVM